jgi:hypothetical protein
MDKLQILFPEPQLLRLRRMARDQDRPVSETVAEEPPRYHCGEMLADGIELRTLANEDRDPS